MVLMCLVIYRLWITIRIIWLEYGQNVRLVWVAETKMVTSTNFSSFRSQIKEKEKIRDHNSVTNKCRYHHRGSNDKSNIEDKRTFYSGTHTSRRANNHINVTIWAIVMWVLCFTRSFALGWWGNVENSVHPRMRRVYFDECSVLSAVKIIICYF